METGVVMAVSPLAVGERKRRLGARVAQLDGQRKNDVLFQGRSLFHIDAELLVEELQARIDKILGRAGSRGNRSNFDAAEPIQVDIRRSVDQIGGYAVLRGDLFQAVAVGAVLAADDDHELDLRQ